MNKIFFLLGLFLYLFSFSFESYFLNIISILFFLCYVLFLLKNDSDFSVIILFFVWSFAITSIICCVAEFGGYFTEVQENSYLTGATARNIVLTFFTIFFSRMSFSFFIRALPSIQIKTGLYQLPNKIIEIIYLTIIVILFFIWLKYGHPNDYGMDRFNYWSGVAPSWGKWIQNISVLFMIYLGSMYAYTKRNYYLIIVVIGNIVYYLVGEKFTIFMQSFFFFIIPVLLLNSDRLIKIVFNKKSLLLILILLIILSITIYSSYFYISAGDSELATTRFLSRILLQAQMWWRIDLLAQNKDIIELDTIITGFIGIGADATETGMYFFMKQVVSTGLYNMMVEQGITFTMLYPANLIYFFSFPMAILVTAIIGFYVGFLFSVIYKLVCSKSSFMLLIAAVLYQNVSSIILMGQTFHLFSIRNIIAIMIIVFYVFLVVNLGVKRRTI